MMVNGLVHGRSTLATPRGSVQDASGAAIVNATVTVRNGGTQVSRGTRTDEAGVYILLDLPPSRYEITGGGAGDSHHLHHCARRRNVAIASDASWRGEISGKAT